MENKQVCDLASKKCTACEGGTKPLTMQEANEYLAKLEYWQLSADGTTITKTISFKNYFHTMAFVNAVAYMTHYENHHPDLEISYNKCIINYTTHAIDGLSLNDFICAAKVDELLNISRK